MFQEQLKGESSSFTEEDERKRQLEGKAKEELHAFKALQAKEHASEAGESYVNESCHG